MANRHQGYVVILADDLRPEDSASLVTAIGMVRGVLSVQPIEADGGDLIARAREFERWRAAMVKIIQHGPDCVRAPYEDDRG
jgi:hypothetical protein